MPRTTLTQDIIDQLSALIKKGLYVQDACALVGIGESSYYQWLAQGKKETGTIFAGLAEAVKKAEAEDKARRIEAISLAGDGGAVTQRETITKKDGSVAVIEKVSAPQWQAHMTALERRHREQYAQPRAGLLGDVPAGGKLLFRAIEIVTTGGEKLETLPVIEAEGGKE